MSSDEHPVGDRSAHASDPGDEPQDERPSRNEGTAWRRALRGLVSLVLLVAALAVGVVVGRTTTTTDRDEADDAGSEAAVSEPAQTVWTCSMHPQIRMEDEGQCPICGMDLVVAENAAAFEGDSSPATVSLSPRAQALAQLRTTRVVRADPRPQMRLLGRVDYDETKLRIVTPWTDGRIDRLVVRVTGARVSRGQVVAYLYSPEVYAAMRDLLVAKRHADRLGAGMLGADRLATAAVESSREKLRLLGVSESEIESIEREEKTPKKIAIRSRFSGTVLERNVEQGDYVEATTALYQLADLSTVWVQIDAYESDLAYLAVGKTVLIEIESMPGESFVGEVAFIDPVVDPDTRTARVRVEVDNAQRRLRPGMFAQAVVEADVESGPRPPVVPASAVLFTGRRSVVYVAVPGRHGRYALREVRLGARAGPVYPVLAGLSEGEEVVTRGAFVLDADLQLQGGRSMMTLSDDRDVVKDAPLVTPPMLAELEPVVAAYLAAQEQLAVDDFASARESFEQLATAVVGVQLPAVSSTRQVWRELASSLSGQARRGATARDESEVRIAFEHLSTRIVELLRMFGNPHDEPVNVAHCPMAFDSRGAAWVQAEDRIANPYYGPTMLRCGDVRATVLPGERLPAEGSSPAPEPSGGAGHQH